MRVKRAGRRRPRGEGGFLTLVDRGHHCLPVCADFTGRTVPTDKDDIIHVHLQEKDGDDCIMHNIGGQRAR